MNHSFVLPAFVFHFYLWKFWIWLWYPLHIYLLCLSGELPPDVSNALWARSGSQLIHLLRLSGEFPPNCSLSLSKALNNINVYEFGSMTVSEL